MSITTTDDLPSLRDRAHEVIKSNPSGTILVKALELLALISRTEAMQVSSEAMSAQALVKIRARLAERMADLEDEAGAESRYAVAE